MLFTANLGPKFCFELEPFLGTPLLIATKVTCSIRIDINLIPIASEQKAKGVSDFQKMKEDFLP